MQVELMGQYWLKLQDFSVKAKFMMLSQQLCATADLIKHEESKEHN